MNLLAPSRNASRYMRWLIGLLRLGVVKRYPLDKTIAVSGHTYGSNGSHFFIEALRIREQGGSISEFLQNYYAVNKVQTYFEVVGPPVCERYKQYYFLPWESNRFKNLERFPFSHKFGPTPPPALSKVIDRLLAIEKKIRIEGFQQFSRLDGILRASPMVGENGETKFLVQDGQHRSAVLSGLGITHAYYMTDAAYLGQLRPQRPIDVREAKDWPLVKSGITTESQAIIYFNKVFYNELSVHVS